MAFGGNPTVLGSGLPIATGGVSVVSGPASSTDNAIVRWNGTGGNLVQNSVNILSDNGDLSLPSTATLGLQLYNTADQTTNYERLEALWGSNLAIVRSVAAGSGTPRKLVFQARLASGVNTQATLDGNAAPFVDITRSAATSAAGTWFRFGDSTGTSTATSSTVNFLVISPTYNQASGTAANTDLKIVRTQTAIGSGAQYLIQAGTAAAESLFTVSNLGYGTFGGVTPTTTAFLHTAAGTTGVSSIRIPHGSAPTSPVDGDMWTTTAGLFVRINGATVGPLS